jgi:hypothetical protein
LRRAAVSGGLALARRHARSRSRTPTRRLRCCSRSRSRSVLAALRLVLRVAGAVPLLSIRSSACSISPARAASFISRIGRPPSRRPADLRPLHSLLDRRVGVRARPTKTEERHADAVAAETRSIPALFRERRRAAANIARAAGLRLSGDDEPLQSAVHDLPAHLRGARAARRHELAAVHLDRRPDSRICSARCCTASASRCW